MNTDEIESHSTEVGLSSQRGELAVRLRGVGRDSLDFGGQGILLGLAAFAFALPALPGSAFDLIFTGGRVVDGTGAPWFRADVGISGDRIAAVGDLSRAAAKRRIDASHLVVAPGFIDMLGQSEYNVLPDNRAASKITQGITTEITGEGSSIALSESFRRGPKASTSRRTSIPGRRARTPSPACGIRSPAPACAPNFPGTTRTGASGPARAS